MRFFFSILLLALAVGCDDASQASPSAPLLSEISGSGVIKGIVKFNGAAPQMQTIAANEKCCEGEPPLSEETIVVNENGTLRNVLVYLEGAPKVDGSRQTPAVLDQVRCRYTPHVLGVQIGQPLRVRSSDPTMHNVHFTPQLNRARNLSMTQAGQETIVTFSAAEIIRMKCDVHPWMTAWVGVFDNPFFSVTSDTGAFEISGIPAGNYTLVAWHELYGRQEQKVTVADDSLLEVAFAFSSGK